MADRTPRSVIGDDAYMQLVFEGYEVAKADELARLREAERKMRDFIEFVKSSPVNSGVCCCGDEMDTHPEPMSCGHTPVDQWHYSLSQWLDQIGGGR